MGGFAGSVISFPGSMGSSAVGFGGLAAGTAGVAAPLAGAVGAGKLIGDWQNRKADKSSNAAAQNFWTNEIKKVSDTLNAKQAAGTATPEDYQLAHSTVARYMELFQNEASHRGDLGTAGVQTLNSWVQPKMADWRKAGGYENPDPNNPTIYDKWGMESYPWPAITGDPWGIGANAPTVTGASKSGAPPSTPDPNSLQNRLLKGGVAAGGGILASILGNKQTGSESDAISDLIAGNEASRTAGTDFLAMSKGPINSATSFWQRMLDDGSKASPTAVLGPEIRSETERFDNTMKSQRELAPRSGMADQRASDLPFEKAKSVTNLYQKLLQDREKEKAALRDQAPAGLATLGANVAGLGFQGLTGNRAGTSDVLQYESGRRTQATNFGASIGESLAKILFGGGK